MGKVAAEDGDEMTLGEETIAMAEHLRAYPEVGPLWALSSEEIKALLRFANTRADADFPDACLACCKAIENVKKAEKKAKRIVREFLRVMEQEGTPVSPRVANDLKRRAGIKIK